MVPPIKLPNTILLNLYLLAYILALNPAGPLPTIAISYILFNVSGIVISSPNYLFHFIIPVK